MLYAELEVARWLLHGARPATSDRRRRRRMLDGLVDSVHSNSANPLSTATGPIMAVADVEAMLDRTPGDRNSDDYGHAGGMKPVVEDQSERNSSSA